MPSCWRKIVIAVFCEICLSCSMIGETVFLRPCEAPLINGMTGKWNTTGTQEERLAKMLEAVVHGFFPETKKRMMTKQKLANAAVFWHTSQSLMRGLHFRWMNQSRTTTPWNMPMHKKIPDQQYDTTQQQKITLVLKNISRHILATKRKIPLKNNFSQFCFIYYKTNYNYFGKF